MNIKNIVVQRSFMWMLVGVLVAAARVSYNGVSIDTISGDGTYVLVSASCFFFFFCSRFCYSCNYCCHCYTYRTAVLSQVTLATMECYTLLFLASFSTSSIFSLPTVSLIPSMSFVFCLPLARFLSIYTCPRYPSCLLFPAVMSPLVAPVICITSWFVLLSITGSS